LRATGSQPDGWILTAHLQQLFYHFVLFLSRRRRAFAKDIWSSIDGVASNRKSENHESMISTTTRRIFPSGHRRVPELMRSRPGTRKACSLPIAFERRRCLAAQVLVRTIAEGLQMLHHDVLAFGTFVVSVHQCLAVSGNRHFADLAPYNLAIVIHFTAL
jgi:hypothetical protein